MSFLLLSVILPWFSRSICPGEYAGTPPSGYEAVPDLAEYNKALSELDVNAVMEDLSNLFLSSQDCWPADIYDSGQSYGPLFVRLAWHCSGSFRDTDGHGGCGGGRQRFWPEASWDDNTNLDKARGLLAPIKRKYGKGLSWGDLFILAGTTAILDMGGPVSEICFGRIDSPDGKESEPLGPGPKAPPCPTPGKCKRPLGTAKIGLIYVNPEGYMGIPDPARSAISVRDIFSRMGMNDYETVALIGGGHAFGKCHGACPLGAGKAPHEDPYNPWPGNCGTGKGFDTYTTGIEGQWTSNPLGWDNQYFKLLVNGNYKLVKGPGDKYQWNNMDSDRLIMLTSDMSLMYDPVYKEIVTDYANDLNLLNDFFANAWLKLTTQGAKWADNKRCIPVYSYRKRKNIPKKKAKKNNNSPKPKPKPSPKPNPKSYHENNLNLFESLSNNNSSTNTSIIPALCIIIIAFILGLIAICIKCFHPTSQNHKNNVLTMNHNPYRAIL